MTPGTAPTRRIELLTVQALRGVAVLLVVATHVVGLWAARTGGDVELWPGDSAGIDMFFVISGVVMVLSAGQLPYGGRSALAFIHQRIVRVVPLYWLVTTAKIAAVLLLPQLVSRTTLSGAYVLASYLLLPLRDVAGAFLPVLPVGWILTYEMAFYFLVALSLVLRVSILRVAWPVCGAVYLVAVLGRADWPDVISPADPMMIEFLYGVVIAQALRRGLQLSQRMAILALAGGLALILTMPVLSNLWRPISWGGPAAMVVAGAVVLEPVLARRLPSSLLAVGGASYSTYLIHGFVAPVVVLLALWIGLGVTASLLVALPVSALAGWNLHRFVERPLLALLRRRRPALT